MRSHQGVEPWRLICQGARVGGQRWRWGPLARSARQSRLVRNSVSLQALSPSYIGEAGAIVDETGQPEQA